MSAAVREVGAEGGEQEKEECFLETARLDQIRIPNNRNKGEGLAPP